jgi:hypothetical protein
VSERPFYTVPGGLWLRDPALNGCSEDAIAIFHIISESSNKDWRIEVSPVNHAFSVRQCIRDPTRFRRWSEERIDRCLAELRARGCLLLATANDREWLEVPDRLCYCKGHSPSRTSSNQTGGLDPPTQVNLPLPGEMGLLPDPAHWNERTSREEKNRTSTRSRSRDGRDALTREGEILRELEELLGLVEMRANGGEWRLRVRHNARAVLVAIEDMKQARPRWSEIRNKAAWLYDRYCRALVATGGEKKAAARC